MKKKLFVVVITLLFCSIIGCTAFAEEPTCDNEMNSSISPRAKVYTVPSNGNINIPAILVPYVGFTRTFFVSTNSNSKQGALLLYLYNPKGKLVSNDWVMGINGTYEWKLTLPSSGQWRLWVIAQGTDADVEIVAKWIN